jgi:thiol-disulfide isomerase/thioredoxin
LGHNKDVQKQLGGIVNDQNKDLANCYEQSEKLQSCGQAPDLKGINAWFNTPGNAPIDLHSLRGKVVLIDFWAYSCINCQRAIPHVQGWYQAYRDKGFEVIGVHTPEYAFEKVTGNVEKGAADLGITYPVALDNSYSTWTNYRNQYWPAEYLIDANGTVRHTKFGEGDYNGTEKLIRELISNAHNGVALPPAVDAPDTTPQGGLTPETYFGVGKVVNYAGTGAYDEGRSVFSLPQKLPDDSFALRGPWQLDYQGATADGDASGIELNYRAKNVYIVVGGTGNLVVTRDGKTTTLPLDGPPQAHQIADGKDVTRGSLQVHLSQGVQVFSFTYG